MQLDVHALHDIHDIDDTLDVIDRDDRRPGDHHDAPDDHHDAPDLNHRPSDHHDASDHHDDHLADDDDDHFSVRRANRCTAFGATKGQSRLASRCRERNCQMSSLVGKSSTIGPSRPSRPL